MSLNSQHGCCWRDHNSVKNSVYIEFTHLHLQVTQIPAWPLHPDVELPMAQAHKLCKESDFPTLSAPLSPHKEGDWWPQQHCHPPEWGHCFAWVLSSYGKTPVESLSMTQCLGYLAVVTPSKRKSRTNKEECWERILHRLFPYLLQTWLKLFFPWVENSGQGGGPAVVLVLFSCFISTRRWSAGLEMQGLSSTRLTTSPGSTNACSLNQANTPLPLR